MNLQISSKTPFTGVSMFCICVFILIFVCCKIKRHICFCWRNKTQR